MKIYGRASVAGLSGAITWTDIGANSVAKPSSMQATHNWRETVVKDPATGKPMRFLADDIVREIAIEFVPESDGSVGKNTKTIAAGALEFLAPYQIVTLSSCIDTTLNDTWLYVGGCQQSYTPDGDTKVRMNLRRYVECSDDEHTALATEVT